MKYFQFQFAAPGSNLKLFIAAPSMAIARIVARDASHLTGYSLSDLANATETSQDDEQADGQFLTSDGWKQFDALTHSVKLDY